MSRHVVSTFLGLIGAVIGGLLGYGAFLWIISQGLYALVLPGALLGLGCGLLARHESRLRGIVCGVAALALGLYSEWHEFPFAADSSFPYFLAHLHHLKPITDLMIALGAFFGYWWGKEAIPGIWRPSKPVARRDESLV
jgi:hypothetical protein